MAAAYTFYKFKELFVIVLLIFLGLTIFSFVNSIQDKATQQAISSVPANEQTQKALNVAASISDPVSDTKTGIGNWLLSLLNKDPLLFLILALVITFLLFIGGVYLRDARGFL